MPDADERAFLRFRKGDRHGFWIGPDAAPRARYTAEPGVWPGAPTIAVRLGAATSGNGVR